MHSFGPKYFKTAPRKVFGELEKVLSLSIFPHPDIKLERLNMKILPLRFRKAGGCDVAAHERRTEPRVTI